MLRLTFALASACALAACGPLPSSESGPSSGGATYCIEKSNSVECEADLVVDGQNLGRYRHSFITSLSRGTMKTDSYSESVDDPADYIQFRQDGDGVVELRSGLDGRLPLEYRDGDTIRLYSYDSGGELEMETDATCVGLASEVLAAYQDPDYDPLRDCPGSTSLFDANYSCFKCGASSTFPDLLHSSP